MIKEYDGSKPLEEIIEDRSEPLVVDFFATWCGPCVKMSRVLEDVETDVLKVDIDEYPEAAQAYNVRSIPTLLIVRGGSVVETRVGFTDNVNELVHQSS
jgi:thioredoxin 1